MNKRKKNRLWSRTVIISRAIFAVLFITTLVIGLVSLAQPDTGGSYDDIDEGFFYEGISVNGHPLGGLTYEQAWELIIPEVQARIDAFSVSVRVLSSTWVLTAPELGITSDLGEILAEAHGLGRGDTLANNKAEQEDILNNGRSYTVSLRIDDEKTAAVVSSIATHVNTPAVNASATANVRAGEPMFIYTEGIDGKMLNEETIVEEIAEAVRSNDEGETVLLPEFEDDLPDITVDMLKEQTQLIAMHQTYYAEGSLSNRNRIRNIQKAADILNGAVIQVGEEFSFNEFIGPRTENGGWMLAPGIVNGSRYTQQAGGGICQVSTTLYNAILKCGPQIGITERRKHSWPSSYADYGLDATVSTGGPDLKFINNTPSPIYVFAYADNENYIMTVYIYGTPLPEGVEYKIEGITEEVLKPQDPIYIDVPTWPEGYMQTYITARDGYRATAYRYKYVDGELVNTEELYTDIYNPVQGQIKQGVGSALLPIPKD